MSVATFIRTSACLCCLALALPASADVPAWQGKVAPSLIRAGDHRQVEFLVYMKEQADLRPGSTRRSKLERGRGAVAELQAVAARTQAPVLALLEARGLPARAYWIANVIWSVGSLDDLETIARRDDVQRVEANPRISVKPPVPLDADPARVGGGLGWNVDKVRADEVWAQGFTGEGVVIGGQDTGYLWSHPALKSSYRGWNGLTADHDYNWHDAIHSGGGDCGPDTVAPCDDFGHGTHTMGTMVGDDGGTNQIGVAPGARWIGCRNMDEANGTPASYTECFQWFVAPTDLDGNNPDPARAPHVINNSWSCPVSEGCAALTLQTVVENTRAAGIVVVVSAGNGGNAGCATVSTPPAIYDASFSVAATDSTDSIASFSSRGPVTIDNSGRLKPDISAPGVGVRSSVFSGGYGSASGTSMAAPHVAGVVALVLDAFPDLAGDVAAIETILFRSTVPLTTTEGCGGDSSNVPNHTYGYGRIDAMKTLAGDADGDHTINIYDCRPVDASTWSTPGPAEQLRLDKVAGGAVELSWAAPADGGGAVLQYDVLRSRRPDVFSASVCVASDIPLTRTLDADGSTGAQFYLVRSENPCGGNLGNASAGPRSGSDCP